MFHAIHNTNYFDIAGKFQNQIWELSGINRNNSGNGSGLLCMLSSWSIFKFDFVCV